VVGLWCIRYYTARKGISQDHVYRMLWWCIAAGLVGGRLYYVIQQPDLVSDYLLNPQHILATWEGKRALVDSVKSEQEEHNTAKSLGTSAELSPDSSRDEQEAEKSEAFQGFGSG
jgi:hypothetical protein